MNSDIAQILEIILGEENYKSLITLTLKFFGNRKECNFNNGLEDIEPIINSCSIIIFLKGILNEKFNIDNFIITLSPIRTMIVDMKEFEINFKKYIKTVEEFRQTLLTKITI